jgi:uncharacterized membrane protein (UPF0127 family)
VPKQYNLCPNLLSVNFVNDLLIKVGHRDIKDRQPQIHIVEVQMGSAERLTIRVGMRIHMVIIHEHELFVHAV